MKTYRRLDSQPSPLTSTWIKDIAKVMNAKKGKSVIQVMKHHHERNVKFMLYSLLL